MCNIYTRTIWKSCNENPKFVVIFNNLEPQCPLRPSIFPYHN